MGQARLRGTLSERIARASAIKMADEETRRAASQRRDLRYAKHLLKAKEQFTHLTVLIKNTEDPELIRIAKIRRDRMIDVINEVESFQISKEIIIQSLDLLGIIERTK